MTIRALVFDLAGVLLDFGGSESLHKLSDGRIGDEEFFRFWSDAKCAHDFHCGRCTPEEFAWQARVACLSNTDPVNVRKFDEELQLQNWFDECFYSNEIGLRKPDPNAYLSVCKALDVPPGEIVFFGDSIKCVEGAIAVGMHGQHVTGFGDLQIHLNRMGIVDGPAKAGPYR